MIFRLWFLLFILFLVAAKWWADSLQDLPQPKITTFQEALKSILFKRYERHWDVDNSTKGSAFRAISADFYRIDPILIEACRVADIELKEFCRSISRCGADHVMFINPGEVKIRNCALLTTSSTVIWSLRPVKSMTPSTSSSQTPTSQTPTNTGHVSSLHDASSKSGTPTHVQPRPPYYLPSTPHHHPYAPHPMKQSNASTPSHPGGNGDLMNEHTKTNQRSSGTGTGTYYLHPPSYHPQLSSHGHNTMGNVSVSSHRPSINAMPFSPPPPTDYDYDTSRMRSPRK